MSRRPRSTLIRRSTPMTPPSTPRPPTLFGDMIAAGVLVRDATPGYYVYRLAWRDHVETGFAAAASLAAYAGTASASMS